MDAASSWSACADGTIAPGSTEVTRPGVDLPGMLPESVLHQADLIVTRDYPGCQDSIGQLKTTDGKQAFLMRSTAPSPDAGPQETYRYR